MFLHRAETNLKRHEAIATAGLGPQAAVSRIEP
jgi:hypothetical protein